MFSQDSIINIGQFLPKAANAMQSLNYLKGKIFGLQILSKDEGTFCDTVYIDGTDLVLWLEENNLPQTLSSIWQKDQKIKSVRLYSNGELVAKHNYKRNQELIFNGEKVICYASIFPKTFRNLIKK